MSDASTVKEVNELIYEHINTDYAWGNLGGIKIMIMKKNGYINAPKMATEAFEFEKKMLIAKGVDPSMIPVNKKRFVDWSRLENVKKSIEIFSGLVEISTPPMMIKVVQTDAHDIGGTYIHPDLAIKFADWLSDYFSYYTARIVRGYYAKEEREKHEAEKSELKRENNKLITLFEEERRKADEERQKADEERRKAAEDRKKRDAQFEEVCRLNGVNVNIKNKIYNELIGVKKENADIKKEIIETKTEIIETKAELITASEKIVKTESELLKVNQKVIEAKQEANHAKQEVIEVQKEVINIKRESNEKSVAIELLNEKVDIIAQQYVPVIIDYNKQEICIIMNKIVKDPKTGQRYRSKVMYIIRAQRKNALISRNNKIDEGYKEIYRTDDPNPGNLFLRIKKDLKDIASFNRNEAKLHNNVSTVEFIDRVKAVKDQANKEARDN